MLEFQNHCGTEKERGRALTKKLERRELHSHGETSGGSGVGPEGEPGDSVYWVGMCLRCLIGHHNMLQ